MARYPALIHKGDDSDYGISFPDFPGCVSAGSTIDEALEMGHEALQFHVDGMVEDEEAIPAPSTLEASSASAREPETLVITLVEVRIPMPTRRVNITIPGELLGDIDAAAKAQGMSRSAFLVESARRMMFES